MQRRTLAEGFGFVEGPRWRDGRLFFSDMGSKQVLTVDLDGVVEEVCVVEAATVGDRVAARWAHARGLDERPAGPAPRS